MKKKVIEIRGVGPTNKGAHLMLLSILKEFRIRNIKADICIEPRAGMDHFMIGKLNLFSKVSKSSGKIPWSVIFNLFPKNILRRYGLILNKEVDIVLDASGFAYGDFWGYKKIEKRLSDYSGKRTSKAKLVLLPQAFGPFSEPRLKSSFGRIVQKADLIYARDNVSFSHLIKTFGNRDNFRKAPDFTNLLESGPERGYKEGNICVIPNYKMMQEKSDKSQYFKFLIDCINCIQKLGGKPYFLIHEGQKDREIAEEINHQLTKDLLIVQNEDPLVIKNRIKSADLVIVSRFHGLVSALSQGTPAITTSWSHKYKELIGDYQLQEYLIDIKNFDQLELEKKIKFLLKDLPINHQKEQEVFIKIEKDKSRQMWDQIFEIIYE